MKCLVEVLYRVVERVEKLGGLPDRLNRDCIGKPLAFRNPTSCRFLGTKLGLNNVCHYQLRTKLEVTEILRTFRYERGVCIWGNFGPVRFKYRR
jgi:hypothetical protein